MPINEVQYIYFNVCVCFVFFIYFFSITFFFFCDPVKFLCSEELLTSQNSKRGTIRDNLVNKIKNNHIKFYSLAIVCATITDENTKLIKKTMGIILKPL